MAEHHFVTMRQVGVLLDSSDGAVRRRLARLESGEFIRREEGFGKSCWLIEHAGLEAIASDLSRPELKHSHYKHSVGLAWLWLAAWAGAFGPVAEVIGERRVRAHDRPGIPAQEIHAVRLGGYDANGRGRRHYPDLILVDRHGRRLALELELSPKKLGDRRAILGGYGADRRLDGVLYLVEDDHLGRSISRGIHAVATEMGLLDRIHIRRVRPILRGPSAGERGESARGRHRAAARGTDSRLAEPEIGR